MAPNDKPCLKVVGLHVEGLKALRKVDWPTDGMAWGGEVPDMVMVGGVNGSGKTTLLETIAEMSRALVDWRELSVQGKWNAWIDLRLNSTATGSVSFRIIAGDEAFIDAHWTTDCLGLLRHARAYEPRDKGQTWGNARRLLSSLGAFAGSDFPGIVYFPTDRQLVILDERYKAPGRLDGHASFLHRIAPAEEWSESIEAVLYSARWVDLNAKEQGRPQEATHFESYGRAFEEFFGDTKRLVWTPEGDLVVRVTDTGATHPIGELSSGEKQVLLFCAELYRRWRPGSLILIDEPELHFHPSWQTRLWALLERWQKERGGQVIVATQSSHLFSIADPGTTVLLGQGLT